MAALLCLGCGEDLALRAADRRALQGPSAREVVDAWKAVFENVQVDVDEDERLCADTLLSGGEVPGKMCRKCFSGYERFPSSTTHYTKILAKPLKASKAKRHSNS